MLQCQMGKVAENGREKKKKKKKKKSQKSYLKSAQISAYEFMIKFTARARTADLSVVSKGFISAQLHTGKTNSFTKHNKCGLNQQENAP